MKVTGWSVRVTVRVTVSVRVRVRARVRLRVRVTITRRYTDCVGLPPAVTLHGW